MVLNMPYHNVGYVRLIFCAVKHNIAIQWKQHFLEGEVSDNFYPDNIVDFEETAGKLAGFDTKFFLGGELS